MKREPDLVKTSSGSPEGAPLRARGFRRHLAGFELGLISVGSALSLVLLVLPRASAPREIPLPRVDRRELAGAFAADDALADDAQARGLSFDVRSVGEALRRYGQMSARHLETFHALEDIHALRRRLPANDVPAGLLRLRAIQTRLFLRALHEWESTGTAPADLGDLGGDFLERATEHGWIRAGRLALDPAERRTAFHVRWNDLIGVRDALPFAPTLDEWRVYYRMLLRHGGLENREAPRYVSALEHKDPEYPGELARGVLYLAQGQRDAALASLRDNWARHPDGRWAMLSRNYLIYALEGARQSE